MMKQAAAVEESTATEAVARDEHIAPAPRVSVQAFCDTVETAAAIQAAGEDRRLAKAHLRIQMGGLPAAIESYQTSPTPNVIILESESRGEEILAGLDQLAQVCDPGTRVVIIGRLGNPIGALAGGILIGVCEAMTMAVADPAWAPLVSFSLLIALLLFRPRWV